MNAASFPSGTPCPSLVALVVDATSGAFRSAEEIARRIDQEVARYRGSRHAVRAVLYRESQGSPLLPRLSAAGFDPFAVPDDVQDGRGWFREIIGADEVVAL